MFAFLTLLASAAWCQSYPPVWNPLAHYASGDQVQLSGNVYRAVKAVSNGLSPASDYSDWELNFVRANTTLMIGVNQPFPTLAAAWTYALNARVADGAYLHFYISSANGNFEEGFAAPFLLDHASGPRMAILGDNNAKDSLTFSNTNGFIVDTGHSFNTLSGLTMENTGTNSTTAIGIRADYDATISSVSSIAILGFPVCIQSIQSASIGVSSSCQITDFTVYGLDAEANGSIVVSSGLTMTGSLADSQVAFYASTGGLILAPDVTLSSFAEGIEATQGGTVVSPDSALSGCFGGCVAQYGGKIIIRQADITGGVVGCQAAVQGIIDVTDSNCNQNGTDLYALDGGMINATNAIYTRSQVDSSDGSYIETFTD